MMPMLNEAKMAETKRIIIYGDPGTGKSQLASELAETYPLLWIDNEGGSGVLTKLSDKAKERVMLIRLPDSKTNPVAVDTQLKMIKGVSDRICWEHGKYKCPICTKLPNYEQVSDFVDMQDIRKNNSKIVVFDSLTQLKASAIAYIGKGKGEDYKFQHDDWGKLGSIMDGFLSEIQAASYDVVVISHSDMIEKVDGKDQIVPVSGTRNFSRNTGKYFTDTIYAQVKNGKHVFASGSTYQNQIQTKSRSDIKLEEMDKPSLLPFFTHRQVK